MKAFLFFYRVFQRVVRLFLGRPGAISFSAAQKTKNRYWFHGASVGELESIIPVALDLASTQPQNEFVLTYFSASAENHAKRLEKEIQEKGGTVVYCGYSPWEGSWKESLNSFKPDVFLTAKYEAWPDLWSSLAETNTPLLLVSAQSRRSLLWVRRLVKWMGVKLPKIVFFVNSENEVPELKAQFPQASFEICTDPRWDRVIARSKKGNPRLEQILKGQEKALEHPWSVFGSVWPEDLEFWGDRLRFLRGTVWIVPHRTDPEMIQKIQSVLEKYRVSFDLSSNKKGEPGHVKTQAVLVDEMGFLSELYTQAAWAFVGGGFGDSIHSTIEPAAHGIPISAGPNGKERFSEIPLLIKDQQLTLLKEQKDLNQWLMNLESQKPSAFKKLAETRLGGAQVVTRVVEKLSSP